MHARSVVFDLFGDYIRADGGVISLQRLSALLASFGVSPDSARVVMSRLSREGWFDVVRTGRVSQYTPSERGWELLDAGLARIMSPPESASWNGSWYVVMFSVPERQRAVRARLKTAMAWLGFGQLAPTLWLSPHDRLAEAEEALRAEPEAWYDLYEARSRGERSDLLRAKQCWDLDGLAEDYVAFGRRCEEVMAAQPGWASAEEALVARTELIHEYRKFPFRDPDLPVELLPSDWPAQKVHVQFLAAIASLHEEARTWYRSVAGVPQNSETPA